VTGAPVLNVNEDSEAAGSMHRELGLKTLGWSTLVGELKARVPLDIQHLIRTGKVLQLLLSLDFDAVFLD
jgi:hypothetical protein